MISNQSLARELSEWLFANSLEPIERADITPETDFVEQGIVDSLSLVKMLHHVGNVIGEELDLLEIDPGELTTIAGVCRCVYRQQRGDAS